MIFARADHSHLRAARALECLALERRAGGVERERGEGQLAARGWPRRRRMPGTTARATGASSCATVARRRSIVVRELSGRELARRVRIGQLVRRWRRRPWHRSWARVCRRPAAGAARGASSSSGSRAKAARRLEAPRRSRSCPVTQVLQQSSGWPLIGALPIAPPDMKLSRTARSQRRRRDRAPWARHAGVDQRDAEFSTRKSPCPNAAAGVRRRSTPAARESCPAWPAAGDVHFDEARRAVPGQRQL